MIKKVLIGGGVAVLLSVFFFGLDAWSYVRTSVRQVRESVKGSVPVEVEIQRARDVIRDMEPQVKQATHNIAKNEVEVKKLRKQVADLKERVAKEEGELKRLHADAASGKTNFEYSGKKYTLAQVKTDLATRLKTLKTIEETLHTQEQVLEAREKGLEAAQKRLAEMLSSREQLVAEVEYLQTRREMLAAAQAANEFNFDDGQLGRARELVSEIRTRLEVDEQFANTEGYYNGRIPLEQQPPADIMDQVSNHLAKKDGVAKAESDTAESAKHADARSVAEHNK
jgi:uncharacterized protein (DUF3084 family)